tara:strand:- start:483 stop:908 length:426 start_codon:yes stop_codon:yes gene_type:complete
MLNIFELNKKRDEKQIKKVGTYREILKKIHNKIKLNGEKGIEHTVYIIPKFVMGLPAYDQIKCADYCVERLRKNGFVTIYTYPNLIFISWGHVPSSLKQPGVSDLGYEIISNPYKDYSNIIYQISNIIPQNTPTIEYFNDN